MAHGEPNRIIDKIHAAQEAHPAAGSVDGRLVLLRRLPSGGALSRSPPQRRHRGPQLLVQEGLRGPHQWDGPTTTGPGPGSLPRERRGCTVVIFINKHLKPLEIQYTTEEDI